MSPNGRGIATSRHLSFTTVEYIGCGNEVVCIQALQAKLPGAPPLLLVSLTPEAWVRRVAESRSTAAHGATPYGFAPVNPGRSRARAGVNLEATLATASCRSPCPATP